jgi:hypothetical protein
MSFKLNPAPTFTIPVPLSVPGSSEPVEIRVTFKHKNREPLQTWLKKAEQEINEELLQEVITDWSGLVDDEGAPVPYNRTTLGALLENYTGARFELFGSYNSELSRSKRKNF